jgi:sigma-B regulation protein RsbU (phosphoserine phosphatase)
MLKKIFPGEYASLAEIAELISRSAKNAGFNPTEVFSIETAVDEAVSNIIEHAYGEEGKGNIVCSILLAPEKITIILEDTGKPFDPTCIPLPDLKSPLKDRPDHGLGYYMMCQLLDEVHYEFNDTSNRLTLVKNKTNDSKKKDTPDPDSTPVPQWKEFLDLGEELLRQPNAISISRKLQETLENKLNCNAHLWLATPFYPLPGEPAIDTLPNVNSDSLVQSAFDTKTKTVNPKNTKKGPFVINEIALPVTTQGNTLGILHVKRNIDLPFSTDEINYIEGLATYAAVAMQVNRQVTIKNWRYDQLSLVRSVSSQIANVLNLDELCKRVTNLIQCSFNYYHVALFTLNEDTKLLNFRASSLECSPTDNPLFSVTFGDGLIGEVAQTGKEIIALNVADEPRFRFIEALPDTCAEAVLPLLIENRVLGVLDIQSNTPGAFHENDMLVLRSLADNIALGVEGARLYNDLEKKADQLSAVAEINFALSSILDVDTLLQEVVQVIHDRFTIPFVHLYTIHSGRKKVIFQAGSGQRSKNLKVNSFAYDLNASKGMIPYVARTGKSMLANDVKAEPVYRPSRISPNAAKSEMTIPLKFGDDVLGVLDLQSDLPNFFAQNDLDLFEGLASGIALSLRNAKLFSTERWRRKVADSFKDAAGLLSSNLALDELLDRILSELENNLPCDASAIWLLDELSSVTQDQRPLRLAAVRGTSRSKVIGSHDESEAVRKFLDYAMVSKEPIIRKPSDPYGPLGAACNFTSKYSSIAVPLFSANEVIGILTLAHRAEGRYGSEASAIATTFASYASVAIENARLYTTAQEDAWSSTVLLQVAEAMQSIGNVDELLSTMVRLTPLLVGINQCAFFLFNQNDQIFELKTWYGFNPEENEKRISDTDSVALLKLRATSNSVFINDPASELGITSLSAIETTSTTVLLPLISHGEILGAFLVTHNSAGEFGIRNRFSDQTLAILQGIAQQTSISLDNIYLVESRQEEAYITMVLLQVAQAVVSQNKLDDILDTIVHLMPILVGVDTCVIYLWDEKDHRLISSNAIAPTHPDVEELMSHSFEVGEFLLLDQVINSEKMAACPLESSELPISTWNTFKCDQVEDLSQSTNQNWLLGFPLVIKGIIYGVLIAKETNVNPAFHNKRLEMLKGVAQQTALAIQNERLKEEMVDRERMDREFQLARDIQKSFLPETMPRLEGWDIDMRWQTAREVGGDFYDVFVTKNQKIAIVIADVADKGMPAALYMTVTRTLIRASAQTITSPGKVMARVNELLESESQNGMFVTVFFALLDPLTGILEYANAGHNLPLLIRHGSKKIERLLKDGIALGVLENAKYKDKSIQLSAGDSLLLYTDGVTEAFSAEGELFTEPRLAEVLSNSTWKSAGELLTSVESIIEDFRNGEPPSDDLTMIAIRRKKRDS